MTIKDVIVGHFRWQHLFYDAEHDFQSWRSCFTNLMRALNTVIDDKEDIGMHFLNFSKAFNFNNHWFLCTKLAARRVPPQVLGWNSKLANRLFQTSIWNVVCDEISAPSSVPQDLII